MDYLTRVEHALEPLLSPTAAELKHALLDINTTFEDLLPFLQKAESKPYYRKLLYQTSEVELLCMNWSQLACAPHDHGHSHGWIQVIAGTTINTVYACENGDLPETLFAKKEWQGTLFFAPKRGVHHMQSDGPLDLVTLHLYSPPIQNMKVYDLQRCAACVVSEECGAWWPEHQREKLKEIKLHQLIQPTK